MSEPEESKNVGFEVGVNLDERDLMANYKQNYDFNPHPMKQAKWDQDELSSQDEDDQDDVTMLVYDPPLLTFKPIKDHDLHNSANGVGPSMFQSTTPVFNYMEKDEKIKCTEKILIKEELEALLDLIKTPKESPGLTPDQIYKQRISKQRAKCKDAILLEDKLDEILNYRGARMTGVCPIRRHIYDDCFDEVLRQIVLDTPERGILLIRCRLELQQRISTYASLFGSSESYIMRQSILAYVDDKDAIQMTESIKQESSQLSQTYTSLTLQFDKEEARQRMEQEKLERKYNLELDFLKLMNTRLKSQIEIFMDPSRIYKSITQPPTTTTTTKKDQIVTKAIEEEATAKRKETLTDFDT